MNWKINTLEYTNDSDKGVVTAHWDCSHTETVGEGDDALSYSGRRYGSCSFQPDATSDDYIPFEDLTEEIVLVWVQATLDVEAMEASLLAQIEEQKNPKTLKGLAW
jgi:hypothetical protein